MEVMPKVSIVLVNYNGYKDTIECVESLRHITYPNYEIIIVDNASTDQSICELKHFVKDREFIVQANENKGFSAGNNLGIKHGMWNNSDYFLLLNNDTVVEPDFLDYLIAGFSAVPNCGLTIGKIMYESMRDTVWYAGGSLGKTTARVEHWHYREKDIGLPNNIQEVTFATGCCMCLSKDLINEIGLMDETYFLYEEDADYSKRITDAGYRMLYVPQAIIYHKVSSSTGNNPASSQIYSLRNKYIFVQKRYRGVYRISALFYITFQILVRIVKGKQDLRCYLKAFSLALNGKYGKV